MNKIIQLSLTDSGDILIPPATLERLHLLPGMTLVVEMSGQGSLFLRVQPAKTTLVKKGLALVARTSALTDFENLVRNERDRRVFDLLQRTGL